MYEIYHGRFCPNLLFVFNTSKPTKGSVTASEIRAAKRITDKKDGTRLTVSKRKRGRKNELAFCIICIGRPPEANANFRQSGKGLLIVGSPSDEQATDGLDPVTPTLDGSESSLAEDSDIDSHNELPN